MPIRPGVSRTSTLSLWSAFSVGTKSMTLNFDVLRDDPPRLGAAGWMVLVCVDRKGLKPRPLPSGLVEALAPHTLTSAAARSVLGITTPPGARESP